MSTSKGRGAAAHKIAEVVPPEQLRFLFLRPRPNHAIDFDPDGTDQIPRLFDEFDRFAAATAGREVKGELPPGSEATFRYALLDPAADVAAEAAAFRPAFAHLALLDPDPRRGRGGARRRRRRASALTEREPAILDERVAAARGWLDDLRARAARLDGPRDASRRGGRRSTDAQRRFLGCARRRAADASADDSGDAWQALIFDDGRRRAASTRAGLRRDLPGVPRSDERPARRLAAGQPRSGVRRSRRPSATAAEPVMSVGLQRLRDEPDVIRQGAIDKGEDPALVDRALELDGERRRLLGESETPQGGAQRGLEAGRRGDQGRRRAGRTGGRGAQGRVDGGRRADHHPRCRAGRDRGRPRRPAAAHPQPGRSGRPGRRRGGERHGPDVGRAAGPRRAGRGRGRGRRAGRRRDVGAQAALGDRRGARHHRQRPRRQDRRLRLPGLQGRRLGAPARPHQLVPRRPHARERLHRGLAAGRRQHRQRARHRPDPGQGRPDVRRHPRRAVPGPHGRGPGHQPPPRRDPRGGRAADPLRGLLAVLPPRGRGGRQGHPRHPARPPVRQGRDGPVREAGRQRRPPSSG